jgi:hypothetical protein
LIFRGAATPSAWNTDDDRTFRFKCRQKEARMSEDASDQAIPPKTYPAEKARGGEIVLKSSLQRWVVVAGFTGAVALVFALPLIR